MTMQQGRGHWSGTLGFVLAAMGSAVGLGNIWRFSYITGEYGGAAFILVYLGCVVAVAIPIMIAELLIGRRTQRNVVGAFSSAAARYTLVSGWLAGRDGRFCPAVLLFGRRRLGAALYFPLSYGRFCRSVHSSHRPALSIPVGQSGPAGVLARRFYGRHHLVCLAGCLAGYRVGQ